MTDEGEEEEGQDSNSTSPDLGKALPLFSSLPPSPFPQHPPPPYPTSPHPPHHPMPSFAPPHAPHPQEPLVQQSFRR